MADPNSLRGPPVTKNPHGKLYETRAAKSLGGSLRPNSGAMLGAKGDLVVNGPRKWLTEVKTTTDASLSIQLGWLVKISEEAMAAGRLPMVVTSFVLPDGRPRPNAETEWVMVPMQVWKEITE